MVQFLLRVFCSAWQELRPSNGMSSLRPHDLAPSNPPSRQPWQLCYWSMVTLLFAWATWQRFALPLDPIIDPDTWGYVAPAVRKLIGLNFGHTSGRNFIYPGFAFVLLRAFGDFRAITIAQHFLGLVAGGILLLTWRRARALVSDSRVHLAVHDGLGLLAATIFLLAGESIRFETQLRPEGVCAFLISVTLYAMTQFTACFFVERRRTASVMYGSAAVFSSILLASAKPSFWLASIVVLLPVAMFFFQHGLIWQKIALGGGAAASAALLLLPEHFLSRNDEASRTFLPATLFVVHADLICDQMADDLRRNANVRYPREWLERVHGALGAEIEKSRAAWPGHFATLGFDPDYLKYNKTSIVAQLRREFGENVPALCAFYRFYYGQIWRHRPLLVLKKIVRQMAIFYAPICPVYNRGKSLSLTNAYHSAVMSLHVQGRREIWAAYAPVVDFMDRAKSVAQRAPVIHQPPAVRLALSIMAGTHLPLLLIAVVLGAVVLGQESHRGRLGRIATLVVLGYLCSSAACLEAAVIHSLEIPRYLTVQMYLTLLVQFSAMWFILEFALRMRARQKIIS